MLGSLQQTISIAENTNFAFDINASDPDGDNLIYEKTGGVDQNLFTLNITTGIFSFASQPDYESPQDADQNNTYEVWFRAKDDNNLYDEKRLTIHVTDVFENAPPSFQSDGNLTFQKTPLSFTSSMQPIRTEMSSLTRSSMDRTPAYLT